MLLAQFLAPRHLTFFSRGFFAIRPRTEDSNIQMINKKKLRICRKCGANGTNFNFFGNFQILLRLGNMKNEILTIILALVLLMAKESEGELTPRPEETLLNVLGRPFAPTNSSNASFECLRDSKIYFDALSNYSVWALQSK